MGAVGDRSAATAQFLRCFATPGIGSREGKVGHMDARLQRNPPVVHFCGACDEYLNIPMDADARGRWLGECPYCRVVLSGNRLDMNRIREVCDTAQA